MSTTLDLDGETLTLPTAHDLSWDTNLNNTITAIVDKANEIVTDGVTLTGTQTLTNKTLTSPVINGAALSGTITGTPDFTGPPTVSGAAVVTTSGAQVLTNKTLTAPAFTGTPTGIDISGKSLINGKLVCSVGSNALTIALKTTAGTDPSASDPVLVYFRDATLTTGGHSVLSVTAAASLVISSGSTLGTANSTAFRFWVVGFNDGGTFRLGAVNCVNGGSVYNLADDTLESSTAEGGAGAADTAKTIYTGTAVASKAMRILGYLEYSSGLATAGTYASAPTKVQPFHDGVPKPGSVLTVDCTASGAVATGTTVLPFDDTIPQITEGDQYMSASFAAKSAANLLIVEHSGYYAHSTTDAVMSAALFKDATANAFAATWGAKDGSTNALTSVNLRHVTLAGSTSAITYRIRAGAVSAGTTTFNGAGGSRRFGGVASSTLTITEIMG
jgi:hypothetical protein